MKIVIVTFSWRQDPDFLECGDASPLSNTGTRPGNQSADTSAHSKEVKQTEPGVCIKRSGSTSP